MGIDDSRGTKAKSRRNTMAMSFPQLAGSGEPVFRDFSDSMTGSFPPPEENRREDPKIATTFLKSNDVLDGSCISPPVDTGDLTYVLMRFLYYNSLRKREEQRENENAIVLSQSLTGSGNEENQASFKERIPLTDDYIRRSKLADGWTTGSGDGAGEDRTETNRTVSEITYETCVKRVKVTAPNVL